MSSRKTLPSHKSSENVERRISQLFDDLREVSGISRENNQEEDTHDKGTRQAKLNENLSHAFSDAFSDPSLIPSPEPASAQKKKKPDEKRFSIIKGYSVEGEITNPILNIDQNSIDQLISSPQVTLDIGSGTMPEKIRMQIPTVDPVTNQRMWIFCEVERTRIDDPWDESDMVRMKTILGYFDKLLKQHQD
jgi:hypothetical protein